MPELLGVAKDQFSTKIKVGEERCHTLRYLLF